jgi:hypothetical protein
MMIERKWSPLLAQPLLHGEASHTAHPCLAAEAYYLQPSGVLFAGA